MDQEGRRQEWNAVVRAENEHTQESVCIIMSAGLCGETDGDRSNLKVLWTSTHCLVYQIKTSRCNSQDQVYVAHTL